MPITFSNDSSKVYLAKYGPPKIFGIEVDQRESLSQPDAIVWFDGVWKSRLEHAVKQATPCDLSFVKEKVPYKSQSFIDENASHREFTLLYCLFIVQMTNASTCDQLWFIPSSSADPRTVYVKFATMDIKREFDALASKLGWKPEKLGEKLLVDFMETVLKQSFLDTESECTDKE
jgi:hypothetical protein